MKIALLVPAMDLGGVEQGTLDLAAGFTGRGHRVMVLSGPGRFITPLKQSGAAWYRLPLDRKTPAALARSLLGTARIIAAERPDIIHARSRLPAWVACSVRRAAPGSRLVTSIHGFHGHRRYSRVMARGERVIVVSEGLRAHATGFLGADPETVRVVFNGFDLAPFEALAREKKAPGKESSPVIGTVGRLTGARGYPELLEALAAVKPDFPSLKAIIVGTGPHEARLKEKSARLGLAGQVLFARGDRLDFMGGFDLVAVPFNKPESRVPGRTFWPGRTGAEAQAAGIPVVTTASGMPAGTFERGQSYVFVPPRDSRALAAALRFLVRSREARAELSEEGRKNARRHFSLEAMLENTLAVYRELAPGTD